MLPDPAATWLTSPVVVQTCCISYVQASLKLPTPEPALTTPPMLPPPPTDTLHDIQLSETQSVFSHSVSPDAIPTLRIELYSTVPSPAPLTVMLPCSVVGWFASPIPLIEPASYDPASESVVTLIPAVTSALRLPSNSGKALHDIELADAHSVLRQRVDAMLAAMLLPEVLGNAPVTVINDCPFPSWFDCRCLGKSYVAAAVMVPIRLLAVRTATRLPPAPDAFVHATDVPENHGVISQLLSSSRNLTVHCDRPILVPTKNVVSKFLMRATPWSRVVTYPASAVTASVRVPGFVPGVMTTIRLDPRLAAPVVWTAVSDVHAVVSQAVFP
eukprot:3106565-Rhodomonas_salina.1